ncbi:PspA/IM30 family protein [Candidatus Cyanaurora vandensis]|uniref:PspA/IM30 family protein n=1 Tax=Candidatus Cyanaurora vandensis TaxID=2714958 RepID=UPI00257B0AEC|nr:PspA/IM30 family protein [Candidatus Cyanaurora vandensis]
MGLFDRIGTVIKANLNSLVSSAEDPEKVLDQTVNDMQEDLIQMRQAVAQAIASEKRTEQELNKNLSQSTQWQERAMLALNKGDEGLAREALTRKKSFAETASGLQDALGKQKETVGKLRQNLTALEGKIAEAKAKKDLLVARARSAKASENINQVLNKVSPGSSLATFDRMEQKVLDLEARSAAVGELSTDSVEDKFKALESGQGAVDDELLALKAQMGILPAAQPKPQLPEGNV